MNDSRSFCNPSQVSECQQQQLLKNYQYCILIGCASISSYISAWILLVAPATGESCFKYVFLKGSAGRDFFALVCLPKQLLLGLLNIA